MKVYVVMGNGAYGDYLDCVFSTRKLAEEYVEAERKKPLSHYREIEEEDVMEG